MLKEYCYISAGNAGDHDSLVNLVNSARQCGVFHDFVLFVNKPVQNLNVHCFEAPQADYVDAASKLFIVKESLRALKYEYFIWIDPCSAFVRRPRSPLGLLHSSPLHIPLSGPWNDRPSSKADSKDELEALQAMRAFGLSGRLYLGTSAFWIVHRNVVHTVFRLCYEFDAFIRSQKRRMHPDVALTYAMARLCGDPSLHMLSVGADIWCLAHPSQSVRRSARIRLHNPPSAESSYVNPAIRTFTNSFIWATGVSRQRIQGSS